MTVFARSRPAVAGRLVVLALLGLLVCAGMLRVAPAHAQQSPEEELANRYSPILMLKKQSSNCDTKGEGYVPTTVDWLMGNPDVVLKAKGDGKAKSDPVIMTAPTASDLANAGAATYLDFKGEPRNPGCTFETYFKQKVAEFGLEPTVYVKYVYEPVGRRLYLQYWYYFYFNDWNDTHESDWEMLALGFDAETAEQAVARGLSPTWVGYAQHGGGEKATWNDPKLQKEGDHPIAYLSANSHATYYSADTMIGWGENGTAFGCDVTSGPSVEVRPRVVVIPDNIDPNGPFGWALYPGRWGQRDVAMFAGPVGPNMGKKWNDPATAFGNWRPDVLKVPGSKAVGVNTTDLFCSLSEAGSRTFVYFGSHPWSVGLLVVALLGVLVLAIARVWPFFLEALDIYGDELRTFLGIGAMTVPIGVLFNIVRVWAADYPPLRWFLQLTDDSNGGRLIQTLLVGLVQQTAMVLIVAPAIIFATTEIRAGYKPGVLASFRGGLRALPTLLLSVLAIAVLVALVSWTIVLVPVVIYVLVRWQFYSQAAVINGDRGLTAPLTRSWRVTHGHWWRTLMLTLAFQLLGALPGPLIGVILMVIGGTDVRFANVVSSFLYASFIPLSVIGITMTYRRMQGERVIEPYVVTRERDPKKAARTAAAAAEAARLEQASTGGPEVSSTASA